MRGPSTVAKLPAVETRAPTIGSSTARSWLALTALCIAYVFNAADRQLLAILQEPIKAEFSLSDTEIGLLGLIFGLAYAVGSFPLAALADRGWIRRVVLLTLGAWSALTIACGAAGSFLALALARGGVAVGEAGCAPAAHALIARSFPAKFKATALSLLFSAGIAGAAVAFGVGGWIGENWGWRYAFYALGGAGLLCLPIVALGLGCAAQDGQVVRTPGSDRGQLARVARLYWRLGTLRYLSVAACFNAAAGYGSTQWMGSFLVRVHEMSLSEAGSSILAGSMIGGVIGTLMSGKIADSLQSRSERAYAFLPCLMFSAGLPLLAWLAYSATPGPAIVAFAGASFVAIGTQPPIFAMVQRLAPEDGRAMAAAFLILLINLVGLGGGPLMFGFVSEMLSASSGADSLRGAFLAGGVAYACAAFFALLATLHVKRDLAAFEAWTD